DDPPSPNRVAPGKRSAIPSTWPNPITLQAGRNKPPQRNARKSPLRPACSVINKKPGSTEWCEAEKRHPRDLPSRRGEKPQEQTAPTEAKNPDGKLHSPITHQITHPEKRGGNRRVILR